MFTRRADTWVRPYVSPPDKPGLGIEPNEEVLGRYRVALGSGLLSLDGRGLSPS